MGDSNKEGSGLDSELRQQPETVNTEPEVTAFTENTPTTENSNTEEPADVTSADSSVIKKKIRKGDIIRYIIMGIASAYSSSLPYRLSVLYAVTKRPRIYTITSTIRSTPRRITPARYHLPIQQLTTNTLESMHTLTLILTNLKLSMNVLQDGLMFHQSV